MSPDIKGGRDLNSTGFALRSIGGSSDGRQNKSVTYLEPQIGTGILKRQAGGSLPRDGMPKGVPTASALLKLDKQTANSRGILKSDAGARTGRGDALSQRSKKSDKE